LQCVCRCVAVRVLQSVAMCVLQCVCCSVFGGVCVAVCCSRLQCVAVCCSVRVAVPRGALPCVDPARQLCVAVRVLQCVCCRVCVAECVLQHVCCSVRERPDSFICAPWLVCATRPIQIWDMTHSYVRHDWISSWYQRTLLVENAFW